MAQRVQVRDLREAPEIRPVARPVDSYYRPSAEPVAKPAPGDFDALSEAFTQVTPKIQGFLDDQYKSMAEEELKSGAAARDLNKKGFKEAQRLGLIKEAQNPYFVKGYMKQDGRLQGIDYDAALRLAWASDSSRSSDDLSKFDEFKSKFREKYLADKGELTGNLDWMDGFRPAMVGSETNLTAHHISHRQAEMSKAVRENTGREILGLLKQAAEAGTINAPDAATANASKAGMGALISKRLTELVEGGLDGSAANAVATDTLALYALESKDPTIFSIGDSIMTPGGKLSGTADFKAKKLQVEKQLRDQEWTDRRRQYDEEDRPWVLKQRGWSEKVQEHTEAEWKEKQVSRDKTEQAQGLLGELTNAVLQNKNIDRAKLTKLTDLSPRDGAWIESFRKQSLKDDKNIETDINAYRDLMIRITTSPESVTERDIFGPMGIAWKSEDARAAFNEWQQVKKESKADKNPMIEDAVSDLRGALITTETSLKGEGRLNAHQAERKMRKAGLAIAARTDISEDEKSILIEKRMLEIAKIYNSRATDRSKAAQEAGVSPTPKPPKAAEKPTKGSDRDIAAGAVAGGLGGLFKTAEPKTQPSDTAKKNGIPDDDVQNLIREPWTMKNFDEVYGPGTGEAVLRESLSQGKDK